MHTSLTYSVLRKQDINSETYKPRRKISSRSYCFEVIGAISEEQQLIVVDSFDYRLKEAGIYSNRFGNGTWESCKRYNDTRSFLFLDISIENMEEKEKVKEVYKDWKENVFKLIYK